MAEIARNLQAVWQKPALLARHNGQNTPEISIGWDVFQGRLFMLTAFWAALRIGKPTWEYLVALASTQLVLAGCLAAADWAYVRPNQIRRRISREGKEST